MNNATAPAAAPPPALSVPLLIARVLAPFALGYFLSYMYRVVNAVIAPDIGRSIPLDAGALGLMTAAYLFTFGAAQLPLGVALDRYGPRRVEAGLLLIAAAGAGLFAAAADVGDLILGRGLIGLGVSACLMAAIKANVLFFPPQRLALMNGIILFCGGLGAVAAAAPVEAMLRITDWRGVFVGLAVCTASAAALIHVVTPEPRGAGASAPLREQLRGLGSVFRDRGFWRLAPAASFCQGGSMAISGLWMGPWLADVAGLDRAGVAAHLSLGAAGMAVGFLGTGVVADALGRWGVKPLALALSGMSAFCCTLILLAVGWTGATLLLVALFGGLASTGTLVYAIVSANVAPSLSGRATTAVNLLIFIAAFVLQWGMGGIVGLWPSGADGARPVAAYSAAFGVAAALQAVALAWGIFSRGRPKASAPQPIAPQ